MKRVWVGGRWVARNVLRPVMTLLTVLVATLALDGAAVAAQERIRAYDIEVDIRRDGSIDVTERITVRAEGSQIRRGIYRDFPTRYSDRYGNRVRVGLDVLGVERNGAPEAWFTERLSNGIRINTGGDDYLPALPGDYTFTLRYRTTRQLGFFDEHDELYWNAIGTGWIFAIETATVAVRLPAPVPAERMAAEAYTGPQGAQRTDYTATLPEPGVAQYRLMSPLAPYEGFTIVLTFPKGLIVEPTGMQRARWFLADNAGVLVALIGLLWLTLFTTTTWRRVGRDPRPGIIIPRYTPPDGYSPAALRFLRRMGYDMRCFSADLLSLAVGGHVRIERGSKRSSPWRLERTNGSAAAGALEQPLLGRLFTGGKGTLTLTNKEATIVSGAQQAHLKAIDRAMHPRFFLRNSSRVALAALILVLTAAASLVVSGGAGIPAIIAVLAVMLVMVAVFGRLVRAPTAEGRRLLDEIEGLKLYLSVAEKDDLARLGAPGEAPRLDAERFEALLPYAVALDVEDAWTKKFTAAVGAAAAAVATQRMGWYSGSGRITDIGDFTRSIGSSLTSSIASASSPPGSSSGSGGGGSSGGGGGGGGGGGR